MTTWDIQERFNENLIPYSEDFGQWETNGVVNNNLFSDTATNAADQVYLDTEDFLDDYDEQKPRCFSVTVQKDDVPAVTRFGAIRLVYEFPAKTITLSFDTSTGDVLVTTVTGTTVDYGVEDEGDNWRFWLCGNSDATFTRIGIFPAYGQTSLETGLDPSVTGSMTVINAQLENAESPSAYMQTTGNAITWEVV